MTITRKQIRNTATLLVKGATLAGDNVRASRAIPNQERYLPAVNVYTADESSVPTGEAPKQNKRSIDLTFEIVTKDADNDAEAADMADDIAEQIEQIMFKEDANVNGKLGCLVNKIDLNGVTTDYEGRPDTSVHSLKVSFNVEYYKDAVTGFADNTSDLERLGVEWDVGTANDPDPEAEDLIELN